MQSQPSSRSRTSTTKNLHPDVINLDDARVYENVFHKGNFVGTFQFTESGAQNFAERVKPNNIIDVSAITSIYRPGPLSANVHEDYIDAKESPQYIKYMTPEVQEITEETFGFLIFQEQIAKIAHALGKDLTLDEGNLLRKLLTKKGTGKGFEVKDRIHKKFIDGCVEKGIARAKHRVYGKSLNTSLVMASTSPTLFLLYHFLSVCLAPNLLRGRVACCFPRQGAREQEGECNQHRQVSWLRDCAC